MSILIIVSEDKTKKSEFEKHLGNVEDGNKGKKSLGGKLIDSKIFVVWLESFEDFFHFPAGIYEICNIYFKLVEKCL
jgi:hypothetical protein